MPKADDSSLDPKDRRFVEDRARRLLDRADAWGRFPTRVDDLMEAADLRIAASSVFDPAAIMAYARAKGAQAGQAIKSAIDKILGLYDPEERTVHIDSTAYPSRQTFLKLHEAGHHELPTHRKMFRFFQDCVQTLHPDIADQFEREANNFARYVLFQGDTYQTLASDLDLEIKSVTKLSRKFGASVYASAREFARTNHRACLVYILEQPSYGENGFEADVRRIEASPGFAHRFGVPSDEVITPTHPFAKLLPIGRKVAGPLEFLVRDRDGQRQRVIGEALDTTFNIVVLIYASDDVR